MSGNLITIIGLVLIALGTYFTIWGQGKKNDQQNKILREQNEKTASALEKASKERTELKETLDPFVDYAREKFPDEDINTALEKLGNELQNIRKDVDNLTPFVLDDQFKNNLSTKLSKFIQYEKQNNLDKTNLEFILFQEQTPEASELVRFMHSVFKSNDRFTKIAMVVNSGIPPNLQGIIFSVKDPNKRPPSLAAFIEVMKSFNFKIYIVAHKRMEQNQIGISAQKPSYMRGKE